MKTTAEVTFQKIITEGFHEILKPVGFKKKGNNFYLQLDEVGQLINIQKSGYYSKEHIHFTINTGIFIPEHWKGLSYNTHKQLPVYPTLLDCLIRDRIGNLRHQNDSWYVVDESSDESAIAAEMKVNVDQYILPYFNSIASREDVLNLIDHISLPSEPIGKLIVYGELGLTEKSHGEYYRMIQKELHPSFLETLKEYAKKYGIS